MVEAIYTSASSRRPVGPSRRYHTSAQVPPASILLLDGPPAQVPISNGCILVTTALYEGLQRNLNSKRLDCQLTRKVTSHVPLSVIPKSSGPGPGGFHVVMRVCS